MSDLIAARRSLVRDLEARRDRLRHEHGRAHAQVHLAADPPQPVVDRHDRVAADLRAADDALRLAREDLYVALRPSLALITPPGIEGVARDIDPAARADRLGDMFRVRFTGAHGRRVEVIHGDCLTTVVVLSDLPAGIRGAADAAVTYGARVHLSVLAAMLHEL